MNFDMKSVKKLIQAESFPIVAAIVYVALLIFVVAAIIPEALMIALVGVVVVVATVLIIKYGPSKYFQGEFLYGEEVHILFNSLVLVVFSKWADNGVMTTVFTIVYAIIVLIEAIKMAYDYQQSMSESE